MSILPSFFSSSITFEGRKYRSRGDYFTGATRLVGGKHYTVYKHCSYAGKNSEPAEIKFWRPLSKLQTVCPDTQGFTQLHSYIPFISCLAAPSLWYQATRILSDRVQNNENYSYFSGADHIDHDRKAVLVLSGSMKTPLSRFQRMAIAAIAVAQMIRGIFCSSLHWDTLPPF